MCSQISNADCSVRHIVDGAGNSNIHERAMAYAAQERHSSPTAGQKEQAARQQLFPTAPTVVFALLNMSTVAFWQGRFFEARSNTSRNRLVVQGQGAHGFCVGGREEVR